MDLRQNQFFFEKADELLRQMKALGFSQAGLHFEFRCVYDSIRYGHCGRDTRRGHCPLDLVPSSGVGAETQCEALCAPTEQQLLAVCTARLQSEHPMKAQHMMARMSLPIKGWAENLLHQPTSAMTQTP